MAREKAIEIRTSLSRTGHLLRIGSAQVRRVNANFLTSLDYVRPMELDGVTLTCHRAHVGKGIYPAGRGVGPHQHADIQLEYAFTGKFQFGDARGQTVMQPGQCLLIPPGLTHRWSCVTTGMMIGAEVHASGPAAGNFVHAVQRSCRNGIVPAFTPDTAIWARQLIGLALRPVPDTWRRAMIGSLLHVWLADILKAGVNLGPWRRPMPYRKELPGDRGRRLVLEALGFMHANLALPIRLHDIAEHVGLTSRHLGRLFAAYEQESVHASLLRIRIEHAKEALDANSPHAIKQIARASGFRSAAHFTQCFKRLTGRLPRDINPKPPGYQPR